MIRPLVTKDLGRVMDIWLRTNIDSHPFIDQQYFLSNYQPFMEEQMIESKSFIYEIEGNIVGFISILENMFISGLNVDTDYQDNGIGEALLDFAIDKYKQLSVSCFSENESAADFFLENGFEIVDKVIDEDTQKQEYIMVCEQTPSTRN